MTTATTTSTSTAPQQLLDVLHAVDVEVTENECRALVGTRELAADSVRDLRPQMVGAMYEVLHAGRAEPKDLGRIVREPDVEEVLAAAMPHDTTPRRARLVARDDSTAVVHLGDVRVRVEATIVPQDAGIDDVITLALPAARPALSHGFYMIDSPNGMRQAGGPMRRLYLHAQDHHAAAAIWGPVLSTLNDAGVTYRSKVLSHRDGYPRRDAIVVYLPMEHSDLAQAVAEAARDIPGLAPDVSVFARRLAPGVAMADEPQDRRPQYRDLSFGEHRCTVAASAIIRSATESGLELAEAFAQECALADVDVADPAFNTVPAHESGTAA